MDGEVIASRGGNPFSRIVFGAGFPEPAAVVEKLAARASQSSEDLG